MYLLSFSKTTNNSETVLQPLSQTSVWNISWPAKEGEWVTFKLHVKNMQAFVHNMLALSDFN
jgi:hypothetical protein